MLENKTENPDLILENFQVNYKKDRRDNRKRSASRENNIVAEVLT